MNINKILSALIKSTIFFIPAYLVKFNLFGVPTNVLEIIVILSFLLYLAKGKIKADLLEFYQKNKTTAWSIAAILIGTVISVVVNDNWRAGFGIIKGWFVLPLVFAFILYAEVRSCENFQKTIKCLYLSIFLVALISLFYCFFGKLTYDNRLSGFYSSPNFLAMYLSPGIIIGLYLIEKQKNKPQDKINSDDKVIEKDKLVKKNRQISFFLYTFSLFVILSAWYLTYSYAAWVAIMLIIGFFYWKISHKIVKNNWVIFFLIVIISLIAIAQWDTEKARNLKEFSRSSLHSRIMIWCSAAKMLENNWLWGIGAGNFQNKYLEYQKFFSPYLEWAVPQPHNLYLAFWLQTGIIGFLGFIALVISWSAKAIKKIKKDENSLLVFSVVIYFLLHGLLDTPYWKNDLSLIFWIVVAIGLRQFEATRINDSPGLKS